QGNQAARVVDSGSHGTLEPPRTDRVARLQTHQHARRGPSRDRRATKPPASSTQGPMGHWSRRGPIASHASKPTSTPEEDRRGIASQPSRPRRRLRVPWDTGAAEDRSRRTPPNPPARPKRTVEG